MKVCSKEENLQCVNFTYHPKKGTIYLLFTQRLTNKVHQHLRVIEIDPNRIKSNSKTFCKGKIILNTPLKRTGGATEDLSDLTVSSDPKELYLFGKDYFRQWILSFSDKVGKESNYRNIERNIKK